MVFDSGLYAAKRRCSCEKWLSAVVFQVVNGDGNAIGAGFALVGSLVMEELSSFLFGDGLSSAGIVTCMF